VDLLDVPVLLFDPRRGVAAVNRAAQRLLAPGSGLREAFLRVHRPRLDRVLAGLEAEGGLRWEAPDGRVFEVDLLPLRDGEAAVGVMARLRDVTEYVRLERRLTHALAELDQAFALTLPDARIERKLRSTPEYRDRYDPVSGLIGITGVIPDGTYRHVVNALKVAAELNQQGALDLVGVDKAVLVQAIIFHDVGKVQPELRVGDVVDPHHAFEESTLHAARSAEIAGRWYGAHPDVVTLVRYHHHAEHQLPADFPGYLRPMFRLFRLVDGLPACITRRDGVVRAEVADTRVIVDEYNPHPHYGRRWSLDLYTGEYRVLARYAHVAPVGPVIGDLDRYIQAAREAEAADDPPGSGGRAG
jgi:hypothetical protein